MKYWEIIADNLSKRGWSWGCVSYINAGGRTIFVADAHRDDGRRYVVHSDEKLTAFLKHDEKPAAAPDAKAKPAAEAAPAAKSKGGLEKAIAEMPNGGRVIITQDKKEADGSVTNSVGKADKAVYNAVTGDITMTGNPEIRQGISKVVPAEEGVTLIINRDGRYRAIGRTKTLLQDNNEKPAKQ